jgi:PAS domain S-box-containing protein
MLVTLLGASALALLTGGLVWWRMRAQLAQHETTLRLSDSRFRHFFEKNSSVLLLIEPTSGSIIDANQAAIAFYGFPQSQLIGMSINQLNTLAPERVAEERQHALHEERSYFNFQHRLASGAVRDVEVYSTPLEVDDRTLLFSIVHDISERKLLQESLKESELRYRTVADFTVDWEYWILPDGMLRYVSPSCQQISGYSAEQLYADPQLLSHMVHPDDLALFDGHSHQLSGSGVPLPIDFRIRTQDGETVWISHVCRPVFDAAGQPLGLRASNRDITESKHIETALERSHADLQRFSEVTAHHLQEPARRIANYAERLTQQLAGKLDDPEAQLSLDFIGQQARRQQNLLRDVERYLAADQPRGVVEVVDAQQVVQGLLARWKARIDLTGAAITLGTLPAAWIDRPRLNDLFEVALDNALSHGRSARPLEILIEGKAEGGKTCYSVSDNGAGVEAQYRERVFRVFERLAPGGDSVSTGIGLAILRRMTESCGGAARLETSASGGACLVFELATEKLT